MKKLYSKKLGGEAFALDAAQLDTLKKAGYTVPSPEEVIADAAAVKIEPPEGKRLRSVGDKTHIRLNSKSQIKTDAKTLLSGIKRKEPREHCLCLLYAKCLWNANKQSAVF